MWARASETVVFNTVSWRPISRPNWEPTTSRLITAANLLIEYIGLDNLTNKVSGHGAFNFGRSPAASIEARYGGREVTIAEPTVLFNVSKRFEPKKAHTDAEVQRRTSEWWVLSLKRAIKAELACAVHHGVIRAVYRVHSWEHPADGTEAHSKFPNRYRFVGTHVPDSPYVFGKVGHHFNGSSNPVKYFNIDSN